MAGYTATQSNYFGKYLRDRNRHQAENRSRQEAEHKSGSSEQFNNEKIEVAFRRAAQQYQVRPYAGTVTLFRPKPAVFYRLSGGRCLQESRNILLADNGWAEHVANLSVHEVPGDHDSMVIDPYARVLAERMRAVIAASDVGSRARHQSEAEGKLSHPQIAVFPRADELA
jgi:thioesterase domain-containing protein